VAFNIDEMEMDVLRAEKSTRDLLIHAAMPPGIQIEFPHLQHVGHRAGLVIEIEF
jgi:hypothetical protein